MKLTDLVPPVFLKMRGRLRRQAPSGRADNQRQRCASYADAMAQCAGAGYEQADLVEVVLKKTLNYRDRILADPQVEAGGSDVHTILGLSLAARDRDEVRVLDFGGACGAHYFLARSLFRGVFRLKWHVIETTSMARAARAVLEDDDIRFFDDVGEAKESLGTADLVHASGAIQYVPDPYRALQAMVDCRAKHIMLSRMGLTTGDEAVVIVQTSMLSWNGPGPMPEGIVDRECRYPFTFPSKPRIDEILQREYAIRMVFNDPSGSLPVGGCPTVGLAYWAERSPGA